MDVEDYASPVAPYLVFLLVLEEAEGPLSTTRLARAAAIRTAYRYAGYLTSATKLLTRLEREGVLASSHPDSRRSTMRVWSLTEDGRWFLDEQRALALSALGLARRRKGSANGTSSEQRGGQRQGQRSGHRG